MTGATAAAPPASLARRAAAALYRHPRAQLIGLLAAPLGWLLLAYLGSLALFLITSFWRVDSFSGNLVTQPTLDNYRQIATEPIYRTIAVRTVGMAALVTATDIVLALPIAFYMAKIA
jgi:putative spermidine/putrescine transport system permease protein